MTNPFVRKIAVVALALSSLLLAGCNTFNARANQMGHVYHQLPPEDQERLERGRLAIGDTPEMVYIALGTPDERRDVLTADGTQTTWVYKTYWQQYEGRAWLGYRRLVLPARNGRGYVIYHEPVTQDVYSTREDDRIRVTFVNGMVQSVEQQRRG